MASPRATGYVLDRFEGSQRSPTRMSARTARAICRRQEEHPSIARSIWCAPCCTSAMILSPIQTLDPAKVERDLAFLMRCFREVLEESGEASAGSASPLERDRLGCPRRDLARAPVAGVCDCVSSARHGRAERCRAAATPDRRRARPHGDASTVGTVSPAGAGTRTSIPIGSPPRCRGCTSSWCSPRTPPKPSAPSSSSIIGACI